MEFIVENWYVIVTGIVFKVLPFETFSKYVDDALSEMKDVLKQNSAIASIVEPNEGSK